MRRARQFQDWPRQEYTRADFGKIVRGKYAERIRTSTNVVVLDPQIARAFPNDDAVNAALREVIKAARSSTRRARRPTKTRAKVVRAG